MLGCLALPPTGYVTKGEPSTEIFQVFFLPNFQKDRFQLPSSNTLAAARAAATVSRMHSQSHAFKLFNAQKRQKCVLATSRTDKSCKIWGQKVEWKCGRRDGDKMTKDESTMARLWTERVSPPPVDLGLETKYHAGSAAATTATAMQKCLPARPPGDKETAGLARRRSLAARIDRGSRRRRRWQERRGDHEDLQR